MDLRAWIALLEAEGQLARVGAEVDPADELAAVCRRTLDHRGPALLFENIKGHQTGWCTKLFHGGLASGSRIAMMLGQPGDTPRDELINVVRRRLRERVEPVFIPTGPVQANVIHDHIDLARLPVPMWHPYDGGRYINTFAGVVTRDPETDEINVGMYRGMIAGPDKISCLLVASQHWGTHFAKYRRLGKPMPVAVVYGADPSFGFAAAIPIGRGISEYAVMGAIRQTPMELVRCATSDLPVPANAEIVLEGEIDPNPETWEEEGPFGEFQGYYAERRRRPTIRVTRISYRDDPVFTGSLEGAGPGHPNETGFIYGIAAKAAILNVLEDARVPGILDVRPGSITVIRIRQFFRGQAQQAAAALWGSDVTEFMCKNIMVVDEDIDIGNQAAIDWAFGTRVNAKEDLIVFPGTRGGVGDLSLPEEARDEVRLGSGRQNRLLIDATWEQGLHAWPDGAKPVVLSTFVEPEVSDKVANRWSEYGISLPERRSRR